MIIDFEHNIYSYDKFLTDAKALTDKYSDLISYVTIGRSHDNRDIVLLKLGIGTRNLVCTAGVHGRETINPIVMMRIIEYYAELYMNFKMDREQLKKKLSNSDQNLGLEYEHLMYGACIYELLQTFTILFIPLLNPDGYMIALEGFDVIRNERLRTKCKNLPIPYAEWKFNGRGIDLNRNFPSKLWRPKFRNDFAASENETLALMSVFHHFKTCGFLDIHSRGKSIYYYRSVMPKNYNNRQITIAKRLKQVTNYELVEPQNEVEENDTGGNTVHFYSERTRMPALTIETVEDEATFPMDIKYRETTFSELKYLIFEFGSLII